ncbi:MAG: NIL domain-containing protein [Gloeomargaritaceae cyanobacterium C42_A2020_066]|nr:NIL domain-containing protein [Gloeomargaritaceae cyanobacterium C42_A2020_066]
MSPTTQVYTRVRIPRDYHGEPMLYSLITRYQVTVNIAAALLSPQTQDDAWLDLELIGDPDQLNACVAHLQSLNWEILALGPHKPLDEPPPELTPPPVTGEPQRQTRVRVRIPKNACEEPIISGLVSRYGLLVNIKGALLSPGHQEDGWFDLELQGAASQLQAGLAYLKEKGLDVWAEPQGGEDWSV